MNKIFVRPTSIPAATHFECRGEIIPKERYDSWSTQYGLNSPCVRWWTLLTDPEEIDAFRGHPSSGVQHHEECRATDKNDPGCFINCYADDTPVVLTIIHEHGRSSNRCSLADAWEWIDMFERHHNEYLSYDLRLDRSDNVVKATPEELSGKVPM